MARYNKAFLLLAVISTVIASDAQRLRGVLKRPLHGRPDTDTTSNGKGDAKGDQIDNTELMEKISEFDDLIWKMAAAAPEGGDNEPSERNTEKRALLRWRLRGRAAGGSNDNKEEEKDENTQQLTALDVKEGPDGPWHSCVGKAADICEDHISFLNDKLSLVILPYGSPVTMEFNPSRVRIFVDENNLVKIDPRIS
mmetsp:Transcript_32989/g.72357  ORF Transcript_32989/g.72357 Transcript_32989/m.72357 type:complete len:196 (+) Transcript_32989:184-771(+)|eukprot:CAMPEP_0178495804 /NCGR_PEP_ID=MMETSP0696-20121128/13749_1 /TAXON_ID=265572 /ORGANISM="Extubocellulus spinifer, Strain CCMP396" /LENGTH=195 /DNA_ID=CAMNT_0020123985 /DNA_START=146 /DNA_END=733 /DNA_ORIENTATION=+